MDDKGECEAYKETQTLKAAEKAFNELETILEQFKEKMRDGLQNDSSSFKSIKVFNKGMRNIVSCQDEATVDDALFKFAKPTNMRKTSGRKKQKLAN